MDRAIVNRLQGGFPLSPRPYAEAARALGMPEEELIGRLDALLRDGVLSRFGPMYNAERMGGALSLCAMAVPAEQFEGVAAEVNAFPEVAHNYARDHRLNLWFVLATETPERLQEVLGAIEDKTGFDVYSMPKREEFFVGLRLEV